MENICSLSFMELNPVIRRAGKQRKYSIKNRKIFDYEILYCLGGKALYTCDEKKYEITKGDVIFIKPNVLHSLSVSRDEPGNLYYVHLDFYYIEDPDIINLLYDKHIYIKDSNNSHHYARQNIVLNNSISFPDVISIKNKDLFEVTFRSLVSCYIEKKYLWEIECKILLLRILFVIISQISEERQMKHISNDDTCINFIKEYIEKNYFRKITISQLAKMINKNSGYLGKKFKQEMGMTFNQYINNYRMVIARKLLYETDLSIKTIAEMVGFFDEFYFSKKMKQTFDKSPTEIRKQIYIESDPEDFNTGEY